MPNLLFQRRTAVAWVSISMIALISVGTLSLFAWTGPQKEQVETREIVDVHALGRLEPRGRVLNIAPSSGNESTTVQKLFVREGSEVEANALLAYLDNYDRRKAALAEAEARLASAETRLEQIKAGNKHGDIEAQRERVALLARNVDYAERDLARALELHQKSAISAEQLESKQWIYDRAVIELREAKQILISIAEVRPTDIAVAESEVATNRANVASATADLAATEIRAPSAGRILKIHAYPGEKIAGAGLLELGDVSQMYAVAEVYEGDIPRLAPGMDIRVRLDATGDELRGELEEIGTIVARKNVLSNDPLSDTDARVVEVRIKLTHVSDWIQRLSNARVEVSFRSPRECNVDQCPKRVAIASSMKR